MKINYNRQKCIGCSICVSRISHIWTLSQVDGKADLLDSELKKDCHIRVLWPDEAVVVREIVKLCPTRAIQLI